MERYSSNSKKLSKQVRLKGIKKTKIEVNIQETLKK